MATPNIRPTRNRRAPKRLLDQLLSLAKEKMERKTDELDKPTSTMDKETSPVTKRRQSARIAARKIKPNYACRPACGCEDCREQNIRQKPVPKQQKKSTPPRSSAKIKKNEPIAQKQANISKGDDDSPQTTTMKTSTAEQIPGPPTPVATSSTAGKRVKSNPAIQQIRQKIMDRNPSLGQRKAQGSRCISESLATFSRQPASGKKMTYYEIQRMKHMYSNQRRLQALRVSTKIHSERQRLLRLRRTEASSQTDPQTEDATTTTTGLWKANNAFDNELRQRSSQNREQMAIRRLAQRRTKSHRAIMRRRQNSSTLAKNQTRVTAERTKSCMVFSARTTSGRLQSEPMSPQAFQQLVNWRLGLNKKLSRIKTPTVEQQQQIPQIPSSPAEDVTNPEIETMDLVTPEIETMDLVTPEEEIELIDLLDEFDGVSLDDVPNILISLPGMPEEDLMLNNHFYNGILDAITDCFEDL